MYNYNICYIYTYHKLIQRYYDIMYRLLSGIEY